ncbi:MAG: hypothetical protein Ct9H300mP8_02420 [Gammaproteobacteria bacterium]|nr:MAG: hypothetical protein Ct9H300mP8_02420 [Gammaproteobacteria bacterium]
MSAAQAVRTKTEKLRQRIDELDLEGNVSDLSIDGYTVIRDAAPLSFFEELRESILNISRRIEGFRRFPTNLLNEGVVFERSVQLESLNTLYEFLLGPNFIVSQVSASVKRTTPKPFAIHADMNGYEQPFPGHSVIATSIFCCDDFTEDAGATRFVPGSHHLRRHPVDGEGESEAIAVNAPTGSIILWDGAMWHGNCPRTRAGERVVLHLNPQSPKRSAHRELPRY